MAQGQRRHRRGADGPGAKGHRPGGGGGKIARRCGGSPSRQVHGTTGTQPFLQALSGVRWRHASLNGGAIRLGRMDRMGRIERSDAGRQIGATTGPAPPAMRGPRSRPAQRARGVASRKQPMTPQVASVLTRESRRLRRSIRPLCAEAGGQPFGRGGRTGLEQQPCTGRPAWRAGAGTGRHAGGLVPPAGRRSRRVAPDRQREPVPAPMVVPVPPCRKLCHPHERPPQNSF